jgi:hypothetical protein
MTGDQYTRHGQGSQGPHSTTTVYMDRLKEIEQGLDLQKLAAELENLRAALGAQPQRTLEQDEAIVAVGKAAQEAGKGNGTGALEKLASAGQWTE